MNPRQILTLDFGSRAVRGTLTPVDIVSLGAARLLNFNGLPALQNCVWLGADGDAQVGETVFSSGLALQEAERIYQAVPIDAEPLANFLLAEVHRAALEKVPRAEFSNWETLVAAPAHIPNQEKDAWEKRLRAADLPNPRAVDSAGAAVAWHTRAEKRLGSYLVLDLGASASRGARCTITADGAIQTEAAAMNAPGGRAFDQAIAKRLCQQFELDEHAPTIRLVAEQIAERCKEGYANAQAHGQNEYEIILTPLGINSSFKFTTADFEMVAAAFVAQIQAGWNRALYEWNIPLGKYRAVILVGGGAMWKFAREWAHAQFGAERVWMDDYPAETIVRGLPYLAFLQDDESKISSKPPIADPLRPAAIMSAEQKSTVPRQLQRRQPQRISRANPTNAFLLELLGWLGFLGVGWMLVLGKTLRGAGLLISWWIFLIAAVVGAISFSLLQNQLWLLCIPSVLWLGVPLASALLARRTALSENCDG